MILQLRYVTTVKPLLMLFEQYLLQQSLFLAVQARLILEYRAQQVVLIVGNTPLLSQWIPEHSPGLPCAQPDVLPDKRFLKLSKKRISLMVISGSHGEYTNISEVANPLSRILRRKPTLNRHDRLPGEIYIS